MIAFGSQRGNGADLAIHLANAEDNEYVEVAEIRGAIADDISGAFAEMEAKARALTKAKKWLYSLSINPDPAQGQLTREQYLDYIERAESSLGLIGHDRAIVFHIKEDKAGNLREHCHTVWSRTDEQNCRAVNIPWDKFKLMAVTREFAHDHGLTLPEGYQTARAKAQQLSLYEKMQEQQGGITKEQRKDLITDLWRTSDSAQAFVAALEDKGYMLATGKRPYVLVDTFGNINSLPKLIDDGQVRLKDVKAFLEEDFPTESLSTVDEAREIAARHNQERNQLTASEKLAEQRELMKRSQAERAAKLKADIQAKEDRLATQAQQLKERHRNAHSDHSLKCAGQELEINFRREAHKPTGLAAFLSKISGVDAMRRKLHELQDRRRWEHQDRERRELESLHRMQRQEQQREHELKIMEHRRLEETQKQLFEREARSIESAQRREWVAHHSKDHQHMPSVQLALKPLGKGPLIAKAKRRFYAPTVNDPNVNDNQSAQRPDATDAKRVDLTSDFMVASQTDENYRDDDQQKSGSGSDFTIGSNPDKPDRGRAR